MTHYSLQEKWRKKKKKKSFVKIISNLMSKYLLQKLL